MDAIDTNILIRYLTQDDVKQGEAAKELIENGDPKFLTHIVFIEAAWVLKTSYGLDRIFISEALSEVANSGFFVLEKAQIIRRAFFRFFDFGRYSGRFCPG